MVDFNIYLKDSEKFSLENFEAYCRSVGFDISLYPNFVPEEWEGGFLPIRFVDRRFEEMQKNCVFLTGFELYYFPIKKEEMDTYGFTCMLSLRCGVEDSFEFLMALVFGGYFLKTCGGVFADPQSECLVVDFRDLEAEIQAIWAELIQMNEDGLLRTHRFEGWL